MTIDDILTCLRDGVDNTRELLQNRMDFCEEREELEVLESDIERMEAAIAELSKGGELRERIDAAEENPHP